MTTTKQRSGSFSEDFGVLLRGLQQAQGGGSIDSRKDDDASPQPDDYASSAAQTRRLDLGDLSASLKTEPEADDYAAEVVRGGSAEKSSSPVARQQSPDSLSSLDSGDAKGLLDSVPDSEITSRLDSNRSDAVKKPALRFHEAEDVGDAAFTAAWERKVEAMLKATSTMTTTTTTTTVDVSLKTSSAESRVHQVQTVVETILTGEDGRSSDADDNNEEEETDREPFDEDDAVDDEELDELFSRTERILNEVAQLQQDMPVQDAVLAKVLESIGPNNTGVPTGRGQQRAVRSGPSRAWWTVFIALLIAAIAIIYQRYLGLAHDYHQQHPQTVVGDVGGSSKS